MTSPAALLDDTLAALIAICGNGAVLTTEADRSFFAHDVNAAGQVPLAVVRPETREDAAAVIAAAAAQGLAIFVRGGGMSYTDAYLPTTTRSILLDTSGLNAVIMIDQRALYATVEAGCTWADLDAALAPHGVRASFWGPFSGHNATVGGSMSNGTVTFGSGISGTSGDNVLGFEIATVDGRRIRTGMDAQVGHEPFFDQYGPNLTGMFANDAGALGVKLAVTLPLQPRSQHVDGLSFVFPDFEGMTRTFEKVSREALATEALAMDPVVTAQFSGEPDFSADLKMLFKIGRGRGGFKRMVRTVTGGRSFLKRPGYHVHFVIEGRDGDDLRGRLNAVRRIADGGAEIPNTVPSAIRAQPFSPLSATDPKGRRFLPIHGIVTYANAEALHEAIMAIIAKHAHAAHEANLVAATSFITVGRNAFLYEPTFYWEDALSPYQMAKTTATARYPDNPAARALVDFMRTAMVEAMAAHGAAHLQIGKAYPYAQGRDLSLLRAIKAEVDPHNLLNPGALGL
jgi:FAD/FMN-containing dehydrogenase